MIALCRKDLSNESIEVMSTLAPFKAKVDTMGVTPAYATTGSKSALESFGFNQEELNELELTLQAYEWWCITPGLCDTENLQRVKNYRYRNNLMSADEVKEYEDEMNEPSKKLHLKLHSELDF